jgi:hypothetical protein
MVRRTPLDHWNLTAINENFSNRCWITIYLLHFHRHKEPTSFLHMARIQDLSAQPASRLARRLLRSKTEWTRIFAAARILPWSLENRDLSHWNLLTLSTPVVPDESVSWKLEHGQWLKRRCISFYISSTLKTEVALRPKSLLSVSKRICPPHYRRHHLHIRCRKTLNHKIFSNNFICTWIFGVYRGQTE